MDGQIQRHPDISIDGLQIDGHEALQGKATDKRRRGYVESRFLEERQRRADIFEQVSFLEFVRICGDTSREPLEHCVTVF